MAAVTPEIVGDTRATVGECPVWDDRHERLYWVDALDRTVHVYELSTSDHEVLRLDHDVSALALRANGDLLLAAGQEFRILDPLTSAFDRLSTIYNPGPPARFNDGKCDPTGRFWCGTMAYDHTPGAGILYRLNPDRTVQPVLHDVTVSNGLEFTPDGRTLYYIDTPTRRVDAFDVAPETGTLAARRAVVDIPAAAGKPDGMTLDADGCLWVALWDGSAVHRYTPDGRLDRVLRLPVRRPTSVAFGGASLDTLFVTSAALGTTGPLDGAAFAVDPGAKGLPPNRFGG